MVTATCGHNRIYGKECGRPAAVRVASLPDPDCPGNDVPMMELCAQHWDGAAAALRKGMMHPCGCVVLEVIDLTKADPGPGYADMLRSL